MKNKVQIITIRIFEPQRNIIIFFKSNCKNYSFKFFYTVFVVLFQDLQIYTHQYLISTENLEIAKSVDNILLYLAT